MHDLIGSSRDPDQRRRGLPSRPLVLLATLIVAIGVVYMATRNHTTPAAEPTPATTIQPVRPLQTTQPDTAAPASLRCGQRCDTPVLRARAGTGPRDLRLLVNTTPTKVLDGKGKQYPGPRVPLSRGEYIEALLPMGADAAALVQANSLTGSTPPGRVYRLGPRGTVALIGRADDLIQGIGATIWTITYPRQTTSAPGPYTLTEIDPSGRTLVSLSETDGTQVLRATRAGLLAILPGRPTDSFFGAPSTLVLLDPATGNVGRILSNSVFAVIDATDTTVAWSSSTRPLVELYDLIKGTFETVFDAPGYHPPNYGRFSPDHRSLALGFTGLPQTGTNPASYGYLEVLDLTDGRITPINGLRFPPKIDPELDWSHGSGTLILGIDNGTRNQTRIAFWQRQKHAVTMLPAAVPHSAYHAFAYLQLRGT